MRRSGQARARRKQAAFTLVEMLAVVIVILLLSAILFKSISYVMNRAAQAQTIASLEQIQNALNEFNSEYGIYPPVDFAEYEYESATNQTPWFRQVFLPAHNNPQAADFFADAQVRERVSGWNLQYKYGMTSFLWSRALGDQRHWYDQDTSRDATAKARWAHFLSGVPLGGGTRSYGTPPNLQSQAPFTNSVAVPVDGWGRWINYVSDPPHSSYRLWSKGADGADGTADDVHRDSWNQ